MKPATANDDAATSSGVSRATSRPSSKAPVVRLLLLAILLIVATAYQVRVAEFHHPEWFGKSQAWPPFDVSGQDSQIGNVDAASAGVRNGDRLLSVNGTRMTGKAVFGEELAKSHPGDVMTVTVLRRENDKDSQKTFAVPLVGLEGSGWRERPVETILLIILPYLAVLVGFWVAAARPRDPRAWLVLALTGSYLGMGFASAEQWGPVVRDLAVAFRGGVAIAFPIWLLLFGIYFPEPFPKTDKRSNWRWIQWFFIVPLAVAAVTYARVLVGQMENYASVAVLARPPNIRVIEIVIIYFMTVGFSLTLLAGKYRSATSRDSKRRLRLLFVGAAVCFGPLFMLFAIAITRNSHMEQYFPRWVHLPAEFLFFLFPFVLAYVIVVHRAMDVRVALRQGLQYALAKNGVRAMQGLVTIAVFFAAVTLVAESSRNRVEKIAVIAIGLVVIMGIRRGAETMRGWIDRRFFREAYDAERVLSELSDQVRSMVEPQSLLQTVASRISETLHVPQIAIMLNTGSPFRAAYALGYANLGDVSFSQDSAVVKALRTQKEPVRLYPDDLGQGPRLQREAGPNQEEHANLERLQAELLLPLAGRDKLLGFITLGPKRSEEPFTGNDLRLLKSVANQTGLALENAQLLSAITEEVAQRERLNREVEIAREVQERLFPQALPPIAGLDYCGACRPALGVGGDYYDFLALREGKLGIAIGDVSGKGIAAALMMASLEASLRAEATRAPDDLAALVGNVNHWVYQASTSNRYATFFYAQYESDQRRLTYVNAGHNPPILLRRQSEDYHVIRLTAGGAVVGLLEGFPYQQETLMLHQGDLLIAFTDGISEAMNPAEEEFGEERLIDVLKGCADLPAASILSSIMQAADSFAAGAKQYDDMTLVVLRVLS